jgi:transposase
MNLRKLLGLKKGRRYPIKRDWYGRSLRQRCFELFDEGKGPVEVARELRAKKSTVYRYFRQWKKSGNLDKQVTFIKGLLDKDSPDRDRMLEFIADTCGIITDELLIILSKPHGLRRILTRTIQLPVHKDIADKRVMALDAARVIFDHIAIHGGSYEDVLYAMRRLMKQSQKYRSKVDSNIETRNLEIEVFRKFDEIVLEERKKRPQLDPQLARRAQVEINQILAWRFKEAEFSYWHRKAELVREGLTPEQARERLTQLLTDGYDINRVRTMKALQDKIDPI